MYIDSHILDRKMSCCLLPRDLLGSGILRHLSFAFHASVILKTCLSFRNYYVITNALYSHDYRASVKK